MLERELGNRIRPYLNKKKTIIIYGARQVGKTTLVEQLVGDSNEKTLFLNGDDADIRTKLSDLSAIQLKPIIADHKIADP